MTLDLASPPDGRPPKSYHIIFNGRAGTVAAMGLTCEGLAALFAEAGLTFTIDDSEEAPLEQRIAAAISGPADAIVAAGGDGTVLAVAEALMGSSKTLVVLPLGTFNALARELGLSLDVHAAVAGLELLEPRQIDVGEVNGRPFLHNVIIGMIPGIAAGRELVREKAGLVARLGFIRFMARRFARTKKIAVGLEYDSGPVRIERLHTLVVANNSYEQRIGRFMTRRRIDRGSLTMYLVRTLRLPDAIRLAIEMLAGRWRDDPVIEFEKVKTITVHSKRARLPVTMDGEVLTMETPLRFRVRPLSLAVLAPTEAGTRTVDSVSDVALE